MSSWFWNHLVLLQLRHLFSVNENERLFILVQRAECYLCGWITWMLIILSGKLLRYSSAFNQLTSGILLSNQSEVDNCTSNKTLWRAVLQPLLSCYEHSTQFEVLSNLDKDFIKVISVFCCIQHSFDTDLHDAATIIIQRSHLEAIKCERLCCMVNKSQLKGVIRHDTKNNWRIISLSVMQAVIVKH